MKKNSFILLAISMLVLTQIMCSSSAASSIEFSSTLTIITFVDTNKNGIQDAGEEALPNVPVAISAIRGLANSTSSTDKTRENGQTTNTTNYTVNETSHCPIVTVKVTPPTGMVSTSGSNETEIRDWDCTAPAPATQDRTVSFGFAPAEMPTATSTVAPTSTPDPAANAAVTFVTGNTTDLVDCAGTEFSFTVADPEGVKQVYIEFAVAGFDTDFSNISATLDLTNTGGDTWSGTFTDTVSTQGQVTYWRVVVVDNNGIQTVYYEDGKFSFYAADKSCK